MLGESYLQEGVCCHRKAPPASKYVFNRLGNREAEAGTLFPAGALQRALEVKETLKALERV